MPFQVDKKPYRGRFAPTPSGPLHFGSLLVALASFLRARAQGGRWLLRIDDLDAPRCPPGAADEIRRQLEAHALTWDESPRYQSQHLAEYRGLLAALEQRGLAYRCTCTRARLAEDSGAGPDGPVYAGTCRHGPALPGRAALRLRLGSGFIELEDRWMGSLRRDLASEIGDIVVLRADGQPAYQLACVVDDEAQGITEVIRGADLLGSSFQQVAVRRLVGKPSPDYGHLPVLVDERGHKLSKQNHAKPIDSARASSNLLACLTLLGLAPERTLERLRPAEVLALALSVGPAAKPQRGATSGATFTYNALQQTGFFVP